MQKKRDARRNLIRICHCSCKKTRTKITKTLKIVSEYDQEIPQSQTADNPMAPRGRATQPSRDRGEEKLTKAISSLFPIQMIAILEWT